MAIDPDSHLVTRRAPSLAYAPVDVNSDQDDRLGSDAYAQAVHVSNLSEGTGDVRVTYRANAVSAPKWVLMVDLSDVVNWPHKQSDWVEVGLITMSVDRSANAVGAVEIGVVTRIDGTNADVTLVFAVLFDHAADRSIVRDVSFFPARIKFKVEENGSTPFMLGGSRLLNETGLQTDVPIASPRGVDVAPGVGDIVVRFDHKSGGAYNATVGLVYEGKPTE
jgi:hypothetical protein